LLGVSSVTGTPEVMVESVSGFVSFRFLSTRMLLANGLYSITGILDRLELFLIQKRLIGAPVDNWWSSAQLKKPLEDTLLPLIYDMTDKGNLTWSKMQSDTVNGQNVYRLPFSLTKTALFNLNGNILVDYSLPKPTAVTGQLFVDKTTYLPVRLSIELGSRHIIIDLNNYNGDAITLPSTILTVDQARALVSSSTLAK
jgi:hypothetical protein